MYFPVEITNYLLYGISTSSLFVFLQDDYMEALSKLHMTVTRAYKVGALYTGVLYT